MEESLTMVVAAEGISISEQQMYRIVKRYLIQGDAVLIPLADLVRRHDLTKCEDCRNNYCPTLSPCSCLTWEDCRRTTIHRALRRKLELESASQRA